MGEDVRSGDCLPKTEVKKGLKKRKEDTKVSTKMVDEDTILTLIESKKPQKRSLQEACVALGVSDEGSITDLMNRLEELLNYKEVYPKLFLKLQNTGGKTSNNVTLPSTNTPTATDKDTDSTFQANNYSISEEDKSVSLGHFDFIIWSRDWLKYGNVQDKSLRNLEIADRIFLPRIVGHRTTETGNHFILWAAENEMKNREVSSEALTFNHCGTLRRHHASELMKGLNAEIFRLTKEDRA
ncbi:unnamed protein product [Arctogadus glacialis]